MDDYNLLFIISQPRSGSTLLQALMSNNNSVETVSEPWLLLPLLSFFKPDLIEAKYDFNLAVLGINELCLKIGGAELLNSEIKKFASNFYSKIKNDKTKYVLDKTPRYYEILDEILQVFPNAKIIILKRHPFAVLNSIIDTWIKIREISYLRSYNRDILNAPLLLEEFSTKHKDNPNVYIVKYEDIVIAPHENISAIYHWLNIPFKKEYLNYGRNTSYQGTMGDPTGVHKNNKPEIISLESWKEKLNDDFWGSFIKGYGNFLGEEFLSNYGAYEYIGEKTQIFEEYLFLQTRARGIHKTTLKDHLKFKMYKALNFKFLLK